MVATAAAGVLVGGLAATPTAAEVLGGPGVSSAADGRTVTVAGSGFGHGVGMSQFGAYGMARGGSTAGQIMRHYFPGTSLAAHSDNVDLRVNVVDRGTSVDLGTAAISTGGGALQIVDGGGRTTGLPRGSAVRVTMSGGRLKVTTRPTSGRATSFITGALTVRWSGARGLGGPASALTVRSTSANATSTSSKRRSYRYGVLRLVPVRRADSDSATRTRIAGVLTLNLHREYLRGLAEVPQSWPMAALQAQVIAARSYALTDRRGGTSATCGGCHLWDDTRSQVYRGWDHERVAPRWLRAVTATQRSSTKALTVLYRGAPVRTYYFSSSGGRTRAAGTVWGRSAPYLRGVSDPWSVRRAVNPRYALWRRTVAMKKVASVFGLADVASIRVTRKDAAGAALTVTATSSGGTRATVSGSAFRSRLRLPAQWFRSFTVS